MWLTLYLSVHNIVGLTKSCITYVSERNYNTLINAPTDQCQLYGLSMPGLNKVTYQFEYPFGACVHLFFCMYICRILHVHTLKLWVLVLTYKIQHFPDWMKMSILKVPLLFCHLQCTLTFKPINLNSSTSTCSYLTTLNV